MESVRIDPVYGRLRFVLGEGFEKKLEKKTEPPSRPETRFWATRCVCVFLLQTPNLFVIFEQGRGLFCADSNLLSDCLVVCLCRLHGLEFRV